MRAPGAGGRATRSSAAASRDGSLDVQGAPLDGVGFRPFQEEVDVVVVAVADQAPDAVVDQGLVSQPRVRAETAAHLRAQGTSLLAPELGPDSGSLDIQGFELGLVLCAKHLALLPPEVFELLSP